MLERMWPTLKASRTYRLPVLSLLLMAYLASLAVFVAWTMPEQLAPLAELFGTVVLSAAGVAGVGAGAIATRDYAAAGSHTDEPSIGDRP